jgi:SAM-dependent methyltransferase
LLTWAFAWALFFVLRHFGAPTPIAVALPALLGAALSLTGGTRWRRIFIALGYPLSVLASGVAGDLPAWSWLLPLAVLLALYPLNAWRDAPVFPTPRGGLEGLAAMVPLPPGARIVDAGCGMGDALRELHAQYPQAQLEGWEWSWPLVLLCALRCRLSGVPATVRRADIWKADWSQYHLVYLFQRPESMARALAKAGAEMRPGSWLVSLEFSAGPVPGERQLPGMLGRPVWIYPV